MSKKKNIYRYYCTDEHNYINDNITIGDPVPTECKNDSEHIVDWDSLSIKYKAPRSDDIGLGNVANVKRNLKGVGPPDNNNDISEGYLFGSMWLDTSSLIIWFCTNPVESSAIWVELNIFNVLNGVNNIGSGEGMYTDTLNHIIQLKSLNVGSTKITLTGDTNSISIDLVESNININNLSGIPTGSFVGTTDTQNLSNKTLVNPVLTTPQINDTSTNHKYILSSSALISNRIITLPVLDSDDTFVFSNATQTLNNKTLSATTITNNLITNSSYLQFSDMNTPDSPGSGFGRLYKKTSSSGLFWRPDSSSEIDITSGGTSRICDVYYKPDGSVTSFTSSWTDVPMHDDRLIDSNFTHSSNSSEITVNTSDTYEIIARCSAYNTTRTRSASQFRLSRDTGSGFNRIKGTIAFLYHRYDGFLGYETANVCCIMNLNAGDKIKLEIQQISGASTLYIPSEAASISIKNV